MVLGGSSCGNGGGGADGWELSGAAFAFGGGCGVAATSAALWSGLRWPCGKRRQMRCGWKKV